MPDLRALPNRHLPGQHRSEAPNDERPGNTSLGAPCCPSAKPGPTKRTTMQQSNRFRPYRARQIRQTARRHGCANGNIARRRKAHHSPGPSHMVFLAITPQGLQDALHCKQDIPIWCGADAISDNGYRELAGRQVSRFTQALGGASPDVLQDALQTIQEHHPGELVWVEYVAPPQP